MSRIITKDKAEIYYRDWASDQPVKNATLKVYPGAPRGLCTTHKNQVNEDLLAFIKR
jgi:hypothetical protein